MNIKIGTRKSPLALRQTEMAAARFENAFPNDTFEIVPISTKGDEIIDKPLKSFGGKGVFIKELEASLLSGEIDMAVHSAKDMPATLPDGLEIGAVLPRGAHEDVMLSVSPDAPRVIGTGSARREAQITRLCPDAVIKPIRGNIGTRVEKLKNGEYDAIIVAKAAIERLDMGDGLIITPLDFVSAPGQGIIAVEVRAGDMKKYTAAVNDRDTFLALEAERAFMRETGGGCHSPIGAYARAENGHIVMDVMCVQNGRIIKETRII